MLLSNTEERDHEIACVVKKETLTRQIVEKLFQSVQLGQADTTKTLQIQNTFSVLAFDAKNLWKILPERLAY